MPPRTTRPCPCGLPASYGDCCGALHQGRTAAATPEALMRSRYSAFAVGDTRYLLDTWHPSTRPASLDRDPATRWVRLEVLSATGGTAFHTEGTVDFRAHYLNGGTRGVLAEHSRFLRDGGAWRYLGPIAAAPDRP